MSLEPGDHGQPGLLGLDPHEALLQIDRAFATGSRSLHAAFLSLGSGARIERLIDLGDPEKQELVDLDQEPLPAVWIEQLKV